MFIKELFSLSGEELQFEPPTLTFNSDYASKLLFCTERFAPVIKDFRGVHKVLTRRGIEK